MAQASSQTTADAVETISTEFTAEQLDAVDSIIRQNRGRPGALIPVLKDVQDVTGYLPLPLQKRIATGLKLSLSEVYGVVTFYSFFRQEPIGRHLIKVCMGTACYVRGNKDLVENLSRDLDVQGRGNDGRQEVLDRGRSLSGMLRDCPCDHGG